MKHRVLSFALLALACTLLPACQKKIPPETRYVLGTVCTINLFEKGAPAIYNELFSLLGTLEEILSANTDMSNIAEINKVAGLQAVQAKPETFTIMEEALRYSELTGGKFDPTIGPLVKAWNIGTDRAAIPDPQTLEKALALIDYRNVAMDKDKRTIFLKKEGMKLDLGAIAKGFAADDVASKLKEKDIHRAIIDLGGNILALGEKAPGVPWTIGIRDPENNTGTSIMSIEVRDESVVTSGIYERFFIQDGKRYHHILDPGTGFPVENDLLSVSIVSPVSMTADALSTSTFLLGLEQGLKLIEQTENTEAIFIDKNRHITVSSGLKGKIRLLDDRYTLSDK